MRRCLLIMAYLAIAAPPSHAQPANRFLPSPRGVEVFGHVLQRHRLEPIESIPDFADSLAGETLVVVMGSPITLLEIGHQTGGLTQFLKDGGAVLIATDWRFDELAALPREWKLRISGQEVRIAEPGDANVPLTGKPECPVIVDGIVDDFVRLPNLPNGGHPIFAGLQRGLLTNNPSYIVADGSSLSILARFSEGTLARSPERWRRMPIPMEPDRNAARLPFIMGSAANAPPAGRVLVVAGHGVFLNTTMLQHDYDNVAFASNAIAWLKQGPNGPRRRVLFVEENRVVASFGAPLLGAPPVPTPPIKILNRVLDAVQKDRILQKILGESFGAEALRRSALVGLTILLVLRGLWSLRDRTPRNQSRMPIVLIVLCIAAGSTSIISMAATGPGLTNVICLLVVAVAVVLLIRSAATRPPTHAPILVGLQTGSRWPDAFRLRVRELETSGNLWEPAQVLVREWFLQRNGLGAAAPASQTPAPFAVPGGPFRNRGLRRRLEAMWRFLQAPPRPVKAREFRQIREDLEDLADAWESRQIVPVATARTRS